MRESDSIVDQNIDAFARILTAKYGAGETTVYDSFGQNFPRIDVTLEDPQRSGEQFTTDVPKPKAAFGWTDVAA